MMVTAGGLSRSRVGVVFFQKISALLLGGVGGKVM